VHSDVVSASVW